MTDHFSFMRSQMVEQQIKSRGVVDAKVTSAMEKVPRHLFLEPAMQHNAYEDNALPIGGNQTISQPYMVALMTQSLNLKGGEKVLEIGTGSGYQAAILAEIAQKVITIERINVLAKKARERLEKMGYKNILVLTGDGTLGRSEFAPYDRILITAGAPEIPKTLINQLNDGGIIVAPVGKKSSQVLRVLQKEEGELSLYDLIECVFVPLIGKNGWHS